jgi:hypothetical protein
MSTGQEHDLILMLADTVAILADDAGRNVDAQGLRDQAMLVRAPRNPERALKQALMWCVANDGECLGDHPKILSRFREILGDAP